MNIATCYAFGQEFIALGRDEEESKMVLERRLEEYRNQINKHQGGECFTLYETLAEHVDDNARCIDMKSGEVHFY